MVSEMPGYPLVGNSTDTKPSGYPNGKAFLEMDTGDVYVYDAENDVWRKI